MKTILLALALCLAGITALNGAEGPPATTVCVTIADANAQDIEFAAKEHLKIIELSPTEILSFNALLGNPFNDTVDTVTLYVYVDRHAEFSIGNKAHDIKCSSPSFVLTTGEVAQLMRVIKATAV